MIKFKNITKTFKNNFWEKPSIAVDDITFNINRGDIVGFLGANGAGKTTLIKMLMDFSRADKGEVSFSSELGENFSQIRKNIGYLPEKAYLYPNLTGREFLTFTGSLNKLNSEEIVKLINVYGEKMKINFAMDRQIKTYSKGMQQRLGFISTIFHNPKFIVLDEPLSGLDPIGRREFKQILKELNRQGVTVFFSSHVVSDVEEICNKVVFIEKGKLIYEGSIDELLLKHSNDLYRVKILKEGNLLTYHLTQNEKNEMIKNSLVDSFEILEVEKEKPSLEEIIYKVQK